jgi:RNA polymerase sigma-70 factor (ECF subfamily)
MMNDNEELMDDTFEDNWVQAFARGRAREEPGCASLNQAMREAMECAVSAWPELVSECEPEVFAFSLGERLHELDDDAAIEGLSKAELADLYLALASSLGGELAVGAFLNAYDSDIRAVARKFARSGLNAEESYQVLLTHILLPTTTGQAPRIGHYSGRGQLKNWVRVTSTRLFIDRLRKEQKLSAHHVSLSADQVFVDEPRARDDVELDFLKTTYRAKFKSAFAAAVSELSSYQRNVLRQHHIGGVTLDRLASLHDVHRATIARHLAEARATLLAHTRKHMMEDLVIDGSEFESMMKLISSQLEISFSRLLHSTHHGPR